MKGIIIYNGKYGATAQYAKWIGETFNLDVTKTTTAPTDLSSYDFYIIGSSVYIGKLLIKDWLLQHQHMLSDKPVFLFIVAGTEPGDTAEIQKIIRANVSAEQEKQIKIFYLHGQLDIKQLSLKDKIMLKIGAYLARDKEVRRKMLTEFNDVRKCNLNNLFDAVRGLLKQPSADPAFSV